MSYRVGTPNYNLPQTEGSDKRDWADTNQAFLAVDTALKTASDNASSAGSAASAAQSSADAAMTTATNAQTAAGNAQTSAATAGELAQTAKSRADSAYSKAESAETTAATAQTTAATAQTAASGASAKVGDLSSLTTSDKSSAVAAINEVKSDLNNMSVNQFISREDLAVNTPYTCPADGYLTLYSGSTHTNASVCDSNNSYPAYVSCEHGSNDNSASLFCRKGMIIRVTAIGTNGNARFIKLGNS